MKRKRKCIARGKRAIWCDGCNTNATKCPLRDKYRDLRHTKYLKKKARRTMICLNGWVWLGITNKDVYVTQREMILLLTPQW